MSSSVWHPADELPVRFSYLDSFLYLVIADNEFMTTVLYRPSSRTYSPYEWKTFSDGRRWFDWRDGSFTRWAYVSDILNIE